MSRPTAAPRPTQARFEISDLPVVRTRLGVDYDPRVLRHIPDDLRHHMTAAAVDAAKIAPPRADRASLDAIAHRVWTAIRGTKIGPSNTPADEVARNAGVMGPPELGRMLQVLLAAGSALATLRAQRDELTRVIQALEVFEFGRTL